MSGFRWDGCTWVMTQIRGADAIWLRGMRSLLSMCGGGKVAPIYLGPGCAVWVRDVPTFLALYDQLKGYIREAGAAK